MGWFGNLKAAGTVSFAVEFVRRYLALHAEAGLFSGDPKQAANDLVLKFWANAPELSNQKRTPAAVALAAAAMASAIKDCDAAGNTALGDTLHAALQMLLLNDVKRLIPAGTAQGIDSELIDYAYSIFDRNSNQ